jgi:GNAT superfamily N-acetyltransferase
VGDLEIRPMAANDAPEVARLAQELGYPSTPPDIVERLEALGSDPDHVLLVATSNDGHVSGWAHVHIGRSLLSPARAEIGGLVVDAKWRGRGIGSALMAATEQWARGRDLDVVRVRSNVVREDAHRFYESLGYRRDKTSLVFEKPLG